MIRSCTVRLSRMGTSVEFVPFMAPIADSARPPPSSAPIPKRAATPASSAEVVLEGGSSLAVDSYSFGIRNAMMAARTAVMMAVLTMRLRFSSASNQIWAKRPSFVTMPGSPFHRTSRSGLAATGGGEWSISGINVLGAPTRLTESISVESQEARLRHFSSLLLLERALQLAKALAARGQKRDLECCAYVAYPSLAEQWEHPSLVLNRRGNLKAVFE